MLLGKGAIKMRSKNENVGQGKLESAQPLFFFFLKEDLVLLMHNPK